MSTATQAVYATISDFHQKSHIPMMTESLILSQRGYFELSDLPEWTSRMVKEELEKIRLQAHLAGFLSARFSISVCSSIRYGHRLGLSVGALRPCTLSEVKGRMEIGFVLHSCLLPRTSTARLAFSVHDNLN